jgi:DNA-binding MarR family transcriptional regulator
MATTSAGSALAVQLRLAITRTARRLRQEAGGALSPTLTSALSTVAGHGPLTPSELATRERIRRPTVTRLVNRLEAEGLIARTADPSDGRSALLSLTGDGKALLGELRTRKDAYLAHRLRALPPADRATLARAAQLLEQLLEEEGDGA